MEQVKGWFGRKLAEVVEKREESLPLVELVHLMQKLNRAKYSAIWPRVEDISIF